MKKVFHLLLQTLSFVILLTSCSTSQTELNPVVADNNMRAFKSQSNGFYISPNIDWQAFNNLQIAKVNLKFDPAFCPMEPEIQRNKAMLLESWLVYIVSELTQSARAQDLVVTAQADTRSLVLDVTAVDVCFENFWTRGSVGRFEIDNGDMVDYGNARPMHPLPLINMQITLTDPKSAQPIGFIEHKLQRRYYDNDRFWDFNRDKRTKDVITEWANFTAKDIDKLLTTASAK